MTPATPPYSSTTTAKVRRTRRISARTSRTRSRLRYEIRLAEASRDVDGARLFDGRSGTEQIVQVEDADKFVDVVVVDRKATVPGFADGPGDVVGMNRNREADDVDTRGHHLADGRVSQVGERRDDVALLLV